MLSELTGSALPAGVRPLRGGMLWMLVLPGLWASCSAQGEWGPGRVPPVGGGPPTLAAGAARLSEPSTGFSEYLLAESI